MSFTGGQLIGAAIGAAVAFFNPALGFSMLQLASVGMTVGGIIDPPEGQTIVQEGPKLGDLNVQTSEWGKPIPRLFGTYKMAGNVIWALPLIETKHVEESGEGKGGGGTKTETIWYSYAGSWAVGFCEGPIAGITRIWFDSVLVYDGTNYSGGLLAYNYTLHKGSATQGVDWYMQSSNSNTPAYRNLTYIVFREIQLENFGNKLPKVSVELSKSGSTVDYSVQTLIDPFPYYSWITFSQILKIDTKYIYTLSAQYINTYLDVHWLISKTVISTGESATVKVGTFYRDQTCPDLSACSYTNANVPMIGKTDNLDFMIGYNYNYYLVSLDDTCCENLYPMYFGNILHEYVDGSFYSVDNYTYVYAAYLGKLYKITKTSKMIEVDVATNMVGTGVSYFTYFENVIYLIKPLASSIEIHEYDTYLNLINTTIVSITPDITNFTFKDFTVDNKGFHITFITSYIFIDNTYNFISKTTLALSSSYYQYNDERLYHFGDSSLTPTHEMKIDILYLNGFSSNQVTVASIAQELMLRAGLEQTDFDVSEGTDLVNGYVIANKMQTRPAITSITSAYNFDLVETDWKIKLKSRTGTIVDTIAEEDVLDFIKIDRIQTTELSKAIVILYANKDKNYDTGSQIAQRVDADAESTKTYQYAIALSDTKAKQIAEQYLYSEWNERMEFELSVSSDFIDLDPSNVINIIYKGDIFTIRITDITFSTNKQIDLKGVIEDYTVYSSTAIGSDTNNSYIQTAVTILGPSNMVLLDIPMLDNAYNKEGIYIATNGYLTTWSGCNVYSSNAVDGSYILSGQNISGSLIGKTTSVLSSGSIHTWDNNSVEISLSNASLSSVSSDVILSGENYICIGSEILQYKNATDNLDGTFTLDTLLRGRRGTEWAINTHSINEDFVFLDTNLMFDSNTSLNVDTYYKAVTFGDFLDDSVAEKITPETVCLKPLAPSYVRGTRDVSNNLTINWMRRSRDVTGHLKTLQLFEDTEEYQIEIVNADSTTFYTVYTEEFVYSDIQQSTDNSSHISGDPVEIIIYQISSIVQRGYGTNEIV